MTTTTTGIATEFITFSRTSNATLTDSDGKIKWAPHNLLLASEQFDSASWTKTSTTPTANAVAAPNGTTTADTLTASGANGTTLQSYTSLGVSYTFGIWLKRKTGTGNIQIAADSGTYTTVTITSDWALYTVTQTPAAGTISAGIRIVTSADAVEAWGASLYRSDLGGMKANTSAYPMYNPTTAKNLLGFSEDFSNAGWTSFNTTETVNTLTLTSTVGGVYQTKTLVSSGVYTLQCKIKKGTNNFAYLNVQGSFVYACAVFDLVNGVTGETKVSGAGFAVSSHTISTADADGYFTCRATFTVGAASVVLVGFAPAATGNTFDGFGNPTGCTSGNTLFVKQAQLSDSASLDAYVPNYGAAPTAAAYYGPRLDFDGATLAAKGLLVEELRTNLVLYSAQFDVSANWVPSAGVSVSANTDIAPDGTLTADTMNSSAGNQLDQSISCSTSTVYTDSLYFKKTSGAAYQPALYLLFSGGTLVIYAVRLNTDTGVATAVSASGFTAPSSFAVQDAGGYWRLSVTGNSNNNTTASFRLYPNLTAGGGVAGAGSQIIWGAQLETGSFPTSYIPVGSSTAGATRNPDVASVSTQAFPYSASTGSLIANNQILPHTTIGFASVVALASGFDENNTSAIGYLFTGAAARLYVTNGGSNQADLSPSGASASTPNKLGFAFATNDFAAVVNGGTVATDPTGSAPVATGLFIGASSAQGISRFNGHIRQITYLPRRISNTELQTRTA